MRLYFGHPVNSYDTELEAYILERVPRLIPSCTLENPNTVAHQEGYRRSKSRTGNGMVYFYECVLPLCDGGVFLPFGDGMWGAGVAGEARYFLMHGMPVWQIRITSKPTRGLILQPVESYSRIRALSVGQTRSRLYDARGMREYE
ncbi:MAG: hypothetical protein KBC02_03380 [Candidatus Pacebacteria bacterium]|nr:hypothetical protein [Candidatus Paceibacterota bacterium]